MDYSADWQKRPSFFKIRFDRVGGDGTLADPVLDPVRFSTTFGRILQWVIGADRLEKSAVTGLVDRPPPRFGKRVFFWRRAWPI